MKTTPTKTVRHNDNAPIPSAETRRARRGGAKSNVSDSSVFKVTSDIQKRAREFAVLIDPKRATLLPSKLAVVDAVASVCLSNVSLQDAAEMFGIKPNMLRLTITRLANGTAQDAFHYLTRRSSKEFSEKHGVAGADAASQKSAFTRQKGASQNEQLRSPAISHIAMQPAGAGSPRSLSPVRSPAKSLMPDFDSAAFTHTPATDDMNLSALFDSFAAYEQFAAAAFDTEVVRPSTPPPPNAARPAAVGQKQVRWASGLVSPALNRTKRPATASEIVAQAMRDVAVPMFASQAEYNAFLASGSSADAPASVFPHPPNIASASPALAPAFMPQVRGDLRPGPAYDPATAAPVIDPVSGLDLMAFPPPSARVYYVTPHMVQAAHSEFLHISQLSGYRVSAGNLSAFHALTEMCQGGNLLEVAGKYGLKHSFVHDVVAALHTTSPLDVFFWLTLVPKGSAEMPPGPEARLILQQEEPVYEHGVPAMWDPLMAPAMAFDAHPLGVNDAPHAAWTGSLMGAQMPYGQTANSYWQV